MATKELIYVNTETGEILDSARFKTVEVTRKVYYAFYFTGNTEALSLSGASAYILDKIIEELYPWTGEEGHRLDMYIGSNEFKRWSKASNGKYAVVTLKKGFDALYEKDIVRRVVRGKYMLNPLTFFKGNLNDVDDALHVFNELEPKPKPESPIKGYTLMNLPEEYVSKLPPSQQKRLAKGKEFFASKKKKK